VIQADPNGKDLELKKVRELIDRCGVVMTFNKSSDFSIKDIEQDLSRLLTNDGAAGILPHTEHKIAMGAASALIQYLSLMADELNFGQYHLYQHDLSQYMKLDASAVRALNLMPGPRDGSKNMSLYGLLNKCKTAIGTRLLGQWLKQPLMSLEDIEKRHNLVESFVEDTDLRQTMQEEHLKKIPDLYRLSKRFQRSLANLEDVVRAYQVVITLPGFIGTLEAVMDEKYKDPLDEQYTNKFREIFANLEKLQELVETTVDLNAIDNHEFVIKPEFNEDLQNIRERLDSLKDSMDKEHRRVSKDLDQEREKKLFLESHKVHGWCFRLTRNEAGSIRNKKEYKEIATQKNGVYFTTNKLKDLNRDMDQATQNYDRTQRGLVDEVVNVAGELSGSSQRFW
jgi:DNA mismatch repair protein MSH2